MILLSEKERMVSVARSEEVLLFGRSHGSTLKSHVLFISNSTTIVSPCPHGQHQQNGQQQFMRAELLISQHCIEDQS